ncbi:acyl-ACP--UDP-N-acetylglucosamine O-acyltransferase [Campylobacter vulpis]|uniref:Acyl-[acyl-carrier-protein]--UDP-N-acetylglucosamine O-acyltransferase n=1 Tax=Campylobacter vulpis TaxID=1655500 RepID=A0A2G4QYW1_9BACT|nr:acyl-ACP--UDP-N-acetylglucosamine O-acyltransferase [Campylobacter vulpis]MBS4235901.1 acyl-ACP--UDP-N-acetylglucosamine O-acyltransferase [Campylobacter vulpis]MBS4240952.1 acyl-ACP--UDP-N-acetylglucosamine O-acyltransferase [Campylobacter vulpis]MBS4252865.1 acyl-ACP--UDP-N-acetylglucosamine O-acyltransferase [Campylobacter vulpis]MBS4269220.1 acyl-ACP--UDP-N-acetylglucosamine O-acyltransferase [Campylobacter vulpis]MBS4276056.1 acyl-ACP--UDP-N-acetylglucosamine O-acyltransferase [Campylo
MKKIHPSAVVEDGAILGDDVQIEAYAFVSKEAKIGNGVIIKQGARILADTTIGDESRIFSYAIIGDIPQDISYKDEQKTGVIVGKNATIREFATINSGTAKGDGFTKIGDNAFIMAYCHIAHDCILGHHIILANNATLAGHVELDDYVVVGGLTPIHQFVKVGEGAMIAGASALSQDIVPFCLAEGNRASIRSLNLVGIRRRFEKDEVERLNQAYKFLFKGGDLKENARVLLEENESENVKKMCRFILETKRGIPVYKGKNNG